jgi:hypothetical protein
MQKTIILGLVLLSLALAAPKRALAGNTQVKRAVNTYVQHNSPGVGVVDITSLDVQGPWALAWIKARKPGVDRAMILLKRQGAAWKVLTMGTSLHGTGKTYGAPQALRKKWGL